MSASLNQQVQALASRLKELSRDHPENNTLKDAVSLLSKIESADSAARWTAWQAIEADIQTLQRRGLWIPSPEDEELLEHLRTGLHGKTGPHNSIPSANAQQPTSRYSVVTPPPLSAPLFPPIEGVTTILPAGLIEVLNYSYFLHLLVTDPDRVLPQGKSLLSVMAKPNSMRREGEPKLRSRVQDIVHKAFWDEAIETLSNPSAALQLPRIKLLYEDLYETVAPLVPANHPIVPVLTCPLSPTSHPLRSAVTHLRELLVCLRSRCAPIHDARIDTLIKKLDDLSPLASMSEVARLVVDTVRSILELSELMKEDLSQFVIGSMSEKQLRAVLMSQAATQEREVVFSLWRPERIRELWMSWLGSQSLTSSAPDGGQERPWVHRLLQALGLGIAVSCPLPTKPMPGSDEEAGTPPPPANLLPPPLFFVFPTLLYMQNYLQALVIAATLRSLVRLPAHQLETSEDPEQQSFVSRIWILLRAEVDGQPGSGDTKLVNLADEVIRIRRRFSSSGEAVDADEETKLRAAVDRTLQPNDPVFALLYKRLLNAVAERLARPTPLSSPRSSTAHLPERLRTGRARSPQRLRLGLRLDRDPADEAGLSAESYREELLTVKGFEDVALVKALGEGLSKLRTCVEWTERVWPDVLHTNSDALSS